MRGRRARSGLCTAFFSSPRGNAGSPHIRAVHQPKVPIDLARLVQPHAQRSENAVERAIATPAAESIVNRAPGAVAFRHIAPRGAGSQHPEHAVEGRPVIVPFSATFLPGHQTFDQVPLTVFQFITSHRVLRDASYFDNKKQKRNLTCAELVIRQTEPRTKSIPAGESEITDINITDITRPVSICNI